MNNKESIAQLLTLMERLRDQKTGCPWECGQTSKSIAKHTLEEAFEVYEAIEQNDSEMLKDELGDLLFHVVFHARIAEESKIFDFSDVVQAICDKMIRRHPHVFGDTKTPENWEDLKQAERIKKQQTSLLAGIAKSLPATTYALKLQNRAGRVGFDWNKPELVLDKIEEEIKELRIEIAQETHKDQQEDELGDLLFACVNLARKLEIDPEHALKRASQKFERRFSYIEETLKKQNRAFQETSLTDMEALWVEAKNKERL